MTFTEQSIYGSMYGSMYGNMINVIFFDKIKTGNPITDTILVTLSLSILTYFFKQLKSMTENMKFTFTTKILTELLNIFKHKSSVIYEGKITVGKTQYETEVHEHHVFSERFKALWQYIIDTVKDNKSIHSIREFQKFIGRHEKNQTELGVYIVNQTDRFLISELHQIYAYTNIESETLGDQNDKKSKNMKLDSIKIELYSYKVDVNVIKQFVDDLTKNYLAVIEETRINKRFIYTLCNNKWEESRYELWNEIAFHSTRTFNNLFFSKKEAIKDRIDYFLTNKEWYFAMGIPYTLGIALYGPPGTGKTSFIKALAGYTNRHIVTISLKMIKTRKQLDTIFFEDRYHLDNKKGSIGFDKKIIVFEDIDCIGNIVLNRDGKYNTQTNILNELNKILSTTNSLNSIEGDNDENKQTDKRFHCTSIQPMLPPNEEPITLDDILNLWDGIRETTGRILVITTNHYDKLDPALVRPGRIDIPLQLSYVSHDIIREMYGHYFKEKINEAMLAQINEHFYSPAEIVNIYVETNYDADAFLNRLILNQHV